MLVNKSQNLLEVKVLLLALYSQVVEGQVNYVHPGQEGKGQVRAGQREREELVGTVPSSHHRRGSLSIYSGPWLHTEQKNR